jgi:hypothetical protein
VKNYPWKEACYMGLSQFLSWGLCTVSWRSVSQANIPTSIVVDFTLASLQFFVFRRLIKNKDEDSLLLWFFYAAGGVLGTVVGILGSVRWLGQ